MSCLYKDAHSLVTGVRHREDVCVCLCLSLSHEGLQHAHTHHEQRHARTENTAAQRRNDFVKINRSQDLCFMSMFPSGANLCDVFFTLKTVFLQF